MLKSYGPAKTFFVWTNPGTLIGHCGLFWVPGLVDGAKHASAKPGEVGETEHSTRSAHTKPLRDNGGELETVRSVSPFVPSGGGST